MLKTRIIPTLLLGNFGLVKGERFDAWRQVGAALPAVEVYNLRDVDELIILDINATKEMRAPDFDLISELASSCFVPLTVGGGVATIETIQELLRAGADKVLINTAAYRDERFVLEAVRKFGSQCIVLGIDVRRDISGAYFCYSESGSKSEGVDPIQWALLNEARGVGEIVIQNIELDGMMTGYDLIITNLLASAVALPIIASAGAGQYQHLLQAIECGAMAVSAASMFHFTEQTPGGAKFYLESKGISVRK
ncbi:imidazole glycerol phosphate synthase subunit HisF [Chitinibacter sp. GC72]|uniref:imidazole glycerol phosphate synthase subunit HisF n=1 Tax=Chitinibacter sp. GC72 TaxID=1526917 RepID=UPI0012FC3815|nr:imidazole glycerol phosphate synthase cyclase subunit [Chitinibacter sp. GC72]